MDSTWQDLQGRHRGQDLVVLGLGPSLEQCLGPRAAWFTSVGVNDVWGIHQVDYLVVADLLERFTPTRRQTIEASRPRTLIHLFDDVLGRLLPTVGLVQYRGEGPRSRPDLERVSKGLIPDGWTSVYTATLLAWWLGARRIGIAGLDITPNSNLNGYIQWIDRAFAGLVDELGAAGCQVLNLSETSWLRSIPRGSVSDLEPRRTGHA